MPGGLFAAARPQRGLLSSSPSSEAPEVALQQQPGTARLKNGSTACVSERCGQRHALRAQLKQTFGTVRQKRKCDKLDSMAAWPVCAELIQLLHPLYLC